MTRAAPIQIRGASAPLFFTLPDRPLGLNYIGRRDHHAGAVDNRLNNIGWRAFLAMSHKKRLISAGLRVICHALPDFVTVGVTLESRRKPPFSYI
jgi:hypothetical protein